MAEHTSLIAHVRNRSARTRVVGLGCVGLPSAVEFAHPKCTVTGIDLLPSTAGVDFCR